MLNKTPRIEGGFTLVELMVVILIVALLTAMLVPLLQGRIDRAKWSEAQTAAGMIRRAIRSYAAAAGIPAARDLANTSLDDAHTRDLLGFHEHDCEGTYFESGDYTITSVGEDGFAAITVTGGSKTSSPAGSYALQTDGSWKKL
jgi:type IV pilus assembly protein PilA